ncbi:Mur ligase [Coprinopsis marcescibilis]|uniref:Mur ligase n=1 Tax=Coprinopsis marcescibilis TaxID=230819 RepID=A0A5C3KTK6_COPMA|nr:Mur ligase [Coprinopsis marcescibilis]
MSIDLSLDRLHNFLPLMPIRYSRPTIHIAGTNGKGCVSAIIFNSPHLTKITDCITINDNPINDKTKTLAKESGITITPFEIIAVTHILVSALTTVDLDHQGFLGSTVGDITKEKAAIARQGKPIAKRLVEELGGILKPPITVDTREWDADHSGSSSSFSLGKGDSASFTPPPSQRVEFSMSSLRPELISTACSLHVAHQLDNLATALGVIDALLSSSLKQQVANEITADSIRSALANVRWSGRLNWETLNLSLLVDSETLPVPSTIPVLVDGAHNAGSSQSLSRYLLDHAIPSLPSGSNIHLSYIVATSYCPTKPPRETLLPLFTNLPPSVSSISISVITVSFSPPDGMPWVKATPVTDMLGVLKEISPSIAEVRAMDYDDGLAKGQLLQAFRSALTDYERDSGRPPRSTNSTSDLHHLIVVAGSLYFVADFYRLLDSIPQLASSK